MRAAAPPPEPPPPTAPVANSGRYVRFVGLLAIVVIVLITINTLVTTPAGERGLRVGRVLPPFAVPLAASDLVGDADVATHANEGRFGRVAACKERSAKILNICQLYERGPVALVMFVSASSCARVIDELQAALPAFPGLQAAAVALRGDRRVAARLAGRVSFPIGFDREGTTLANIYNVVVCPKLTFAYPGGVVAGRPLDTTPTPAQLEQRLRALYRESLARGWRPPRR